MNQELLLIKIIILKFIPIYAITSYLYNMARCIINFRDIIYIYIKLYYNQ